MQLHIVIQPEMFDLDEEVAALVDGAAGAVASFTGHVRRDDGLTGLTLEHYPGMSEAEIARIAGQAATHWPLTGITVIHRVGTLKPGEAIVLVAVAAVHRAEAFAACEFLMDHLKTLVPFWKREERNGNHVWVEARQTDEGIIERWRK